MESQLMHQYQPQLPQMSAPQLPQMSMQTQQTQQMPELVKLEKSCLTSETYHAIRLVCDEPEKKLIPIKNDSNDQGQTQGQGQKSAPQYYWIIALKSNYGTLQSKEIKTLFYECCEVTSLYGIKSEVNSFGKYKSSIAFTLDERNQEHVKLMNDLDSICMGAAKFLFYYKDKVGREFFDAENFRMAQATGFKSIVTRKSGKNPALYGDLIDYTTDQFSAKTTFTYGEDSKVLEWKDLKGMSFKCVPLLRFKQIFIGGKGSSVQWDIKSAIVTSEPVPYKAVSMQADTAKRLAAQKSDWEDSIEAQIARNNMLNQDKKLGSDLYVAPKIDNPPSIDTIQQSNMPQNNNNIPQNNNINNSPQSTNLEQFMNSNPQQPIPQFS